MCFSLLVALHVESRKLSTPSVSKSRRWSYRESTTSALQGVRRFFYCHFEAPGGWMQIMLKANNDWAFVIPRNLFDSSRYLTPPGRIIDSSHYLNNPDSWESIWLLALFEQSWLMGISLTPRIIRTIRPDSRRIPARRQPSKFDNCNILFPQWLLATLRTSDSSPPSPDSYIEWHWTLVDLGISRAALSMRVTNFIDLRKFWILHSRVRRT